jgi:hypothetical protein
MLACRSTVKKAKFTAEISLNSRGLQGKGELEYLTTKLSSKALVFCPDSTLGSADTLINKPVPRRARSPMCAVVISSCAWSPRRMSYAPRS